LAIEKTWSLKDIHKNTYYSYSDRG